jgi:hypothetical protein
MMGVRASVEIAFTSDVASSHKFLLKSKPGYGIMQGAFFQSEAL